MNNKTQTQNLIDSFWLEYSEIREKNYLRASHEQGLMLRDGICRCSLSVLKESKNPSEFVSFFLIGAFIDQIMYTHFYGIYRTFRKSFRYPKLWNHYNVGRACAHPSHLYGSADLKYVRTISKPLLHDTRNWFYELEAPEGYGIRQFKSFLEIFSKETKYLNAAGFEYSIN